MMQLLLSDGRFDDPADLIVRGDRNVFLERRDHSSADEASGF